MADIEVSSATGLDGNSYTTAISNDQLSNDDFLMLYLEELKSQDPTDPMDADQMLDDQLKMSQIDANNNLTASLEQLSASYKTSTLANAVNMIDRVVETSEVGEDGYALAYKVASVEQIDGSVYLVGNKMTGLDEDGNPVYDEEFTDVPLDNVVQIY